MFFSVAKFLAHTRDERTVIFCDPDPVLTFQNSVQIQPQSKLFFQLKVQVQKNIKIQLFFSINSVQIRSWS